MSDILRKRLTDSMNRFKRAGFIFPPDIDIAWGELVVLNKVSGYDECEPKCRSASDIQTDMHFSKPAVSQILNQLEKKGYIVRSIDPDDRRKINVTITESGSEITQKTNGYFESVMNEIVERFGENNCEKLCELLDELSVITDEVRRGIADKGEEPVD